jgi:hypothetical protein
MKSVLASLGAAALLVLVCHCGSSGGGGGGGGPPGPDAGNGSAFTLSIVNIQEWCAITVDGAPLDSTASYSFDAGTVVDLTAVGSPPGTFTFAYWTNTSSNSDSSTTVTMSANETVSACCQNPTQQCINNPYP